MIAINLHQSNVGIFAYKIYIIQVYVIVLRNRNRIIKAIVIVSNNNQHSATVYRLRVNGPIMYIFCHFVFVAAVYCFIVGKLRISRAILALWLLYGLLIFFLNSFEKKTLYTTYYMQT